MRRSFALSLLLAFLAALFAPVQGAWACPDGTPCVHDSAQGFVCAENQCSAKLSCCEAKTTRCKHGAAASPRGSGDGDAVITQPDHCRYSASQAPELTALTQTAKLRWGSVDAIPAPSLSLQLPAPPRAPVWRSEFTLGYRPPPVLTLGPSRAPPISATDL